MKKEGLFGADYGTRAKDILSERFVVPPFSVLNTREGFWQRRKQQWISIGIKSELGRGYTMEAATFASGAPGDLRKGFDASPGDGRGRPLNKPGLTFNISDVDEYRHKEAAKRKGLTGNTTDIEQFAKKVRGNLVRQAGPKGEARDVYLHPKGAAADEVLGGTSIFDPVLCELVYRWFAPKHARVLDPFAGGSVRGIVAASLGMEYYGVDLSGRQLDANVQQADHIKVVPRPVWVEGDSVNVGAIFTPKGLQEVEFDLLFSCPPYGDLEQYSDDPRDLSTLSTGEFDHKYSTIIAQSCSLLKDNAFAVFVVGDYRDKQGFYNNLPGKTVAMFEDAGLRLYNEIILLNAIGSLPLRINQQFLGSRKTGKCHQNVLVFAKGQPKEFVKQWEHNLEEGE
jgi:16S rRNA G966 N2-methylase RsmD